MKPKKSKSKNCERPAVTFAKAILNLYLNDGIKSKGTNHATGNQSK
jgi:hypothetical protein